MCLNPVEMYLPKPYNSRNIRWKVLKIDVSNHEKRQYKIVSKFESATVWTVGKTQVAKNYDKGDVDSGIHVFVTKDDALYDCGGDSEYEVLAKVQVSGFIAGGEWESVESETWRKAKLLAIYTPSGRTEIKDIKKFVERIDRSYY